jgi:hypothetical protein
MEDELSIQDLQLRKKQATCIHASYKCSCCGLYKDNLHNEYARTIDNLLKVIEVYERALGIESSILIEHEHYVQKVNR